MEHDVKIVIGANYGDEGKGLMSRYFAKQFIDNGSIPITVFHNGSAQRGHTVDYEDGSRHVFHNFAAGSREGSVTYYAPTFLVHPMDFRREANELLYIPDVFCDPNCYVVTPFDMLVDHIIEDYIAAKSGAREYGSCGYGTWSATDRIERREDLRFTISDFYKSQHGNGDYTEIMSKLMLWVKDRLKEFEVDIALVPQWEDFIRFNNRYTNTIIRFWDDLRFFFGRVRFVKFSELWKHSPAVIFEGAQGLLLDKDQDSEWTTTSKTGLHNPYAMLRDMPDFNAEVCYVTRQYVTRHGDGPLEYEADKSEIGDIPDDETNVFNNFQGGLRYAKLMYVSDNILPDFNITDGDRRFRWTISATHCNEGSSLMGADYLSYNKTEVIKQRG